MFLIMFDPEEYQVLLSLMHITWIIASWYVLYLNALDRISFPYWPVHLSTLCRIVQNSQVIAALHALAPYWLETQRADASNPA